MLKIVEDSREGKAGIGSMCLDEIAREGARRMLGTALEVEVAAYIEAHRDERDENGHALVVRNGKARPRPVTVGSGTFTVEAPRVDDRRVDEAMCRSRIPRALR